MQTYLFISYAEVRTVSSINYQTHFLNSRVKVINLAQKTSITIFTIEVLTLSESTGSPS
jgi:hypothetical protein